MPQDSFFVPGNELRIVYDGKVRDVTVDVLFHGGRYAVAPYVRVYSHTDKGYRNFTLSKITDVSRIL